MKKMLFHIIFSIGGIFLFGPVIMYWFIHGSYKRYMWIISGGFPFNSFGSGPVQLYLYIGLFLTGIILILVGFKHVNKYCKYAAVIVIVLLTILYAISFFPEAY